MKTTSNHIAQAARMQANLVKSSLITVAGVLALMIITMAIGEGVSSFFGSIAFLVGLVLFPMAIGFTQVLSSIIIWIKSPQGGIVFFKWHLLLSITYLLLLMGEINSFWSSTAHYEILSFLAFAFPIAMAILYWVMLFIHHQKQKSQ